jgi:hypothetical protein
MPTSGKRKPVKRTGPPKFKKAKPGTPLGWLPAVPEIEKYVRDNIPPIASEKAIRRQINYETLSYYYGGLAVLVRTDFEDERGIEVLAVGKDVWPLARAMTYEQKRIYAVHFPEPWVDFRT